MTLSPEDQKKLYELATDPQFEFFTKPGAIFGWEELLKSAGAIESLRRAVLSLCKPPEPEKVERWIITGKDGRTSILKSAKAAEIDMAGLLENYPSNAPYEVTYLSGYRGQGKPEDGE